MRVVLVRLSALGDIVHTWPLAVALRQAVSGLHLTWVVEEPFRPLVAGHPAVDAVVTVATRRWRRRPLGARTRMETATARSRLRELEADLCLDPQGVLKSAVISRWTGAGRVVGLARPWRRELLAAVGYSETVPGARDQRHVVATNLAMMRAVGQEPPDRTPHPDGRWLLRADADVDDPTADGSHPVVLLPGTGHPGKNLPAATLSAVARDLAGDGRDVVVLWGPGEEARARHVVAGADGAARLAPPTDIPAMARRLAGAALVVGGDTGPVHLAASLGTSTVAVFLATAAERNAPLGPRVRVVSGASPGAARPSGSARARRARPVEAEEISAAARALLADHRDAAETFVNATISPVEGDRNRRP